MLDHMSLTLVSTLMFEILDLSGHQAVPPMSSLSPTRRGRQTTCTGGNATELEWFAPEEKRWRGIDNA